MATLVQPPHSRSARPDLRTGVTPKRLPKDQVLAADARGGILRFGAARAAGGDLKRGALRAGDRTDNRIRSPRRETSSEKGTRAREVGKTAL